MRRAWSGILTVLVVGSAVGAAGQAPARAFVFSAGGGLALADHSSQGEGAFIRVASGHLPVVMDLAIQTTPGRLPIVYIVPCTMPGCTGAPAQYTGPVTALTLAPSLQLTDAHQGGALLYRVGPAVSWLPDRAPSDAAFQAGVRGGVTLRLNFGTGGLLLAGDYVRMFRNGSTGPRWFLPITLGWQF